MKLVSMKRTEKERKESACTVMEGESPDYPWGLRITLNDEQIDALGIKALPPVGGQVSIKAVGTVMSVSDEAVNNGKSNRRIELQITDLAVVPPEVPIHERMYPKKKEG